MPELKLSVNGRAYGGWKKIAKPQDEKLRLWSGGGGGFDE